MHKAIALLDAVEKIPDGASVMIGGFLGVGRPHRIIAELVLQCLKSLTVIANDTARPGFGIGLPRRRYAKWSCHIGTNPETQRQIIANEVTSTTR
jgi:acetate CoA/acetoacetate CoA-transferase alpha subunit